MGVVIGNINFEYGKFKYGIGEILKFFNKKIDPDVSDYCKNKLGIETVYKNYDLSKIDFSKSGYVEPDVSITDLQDESIKKTLRDYRKDTRNIGYVITMGDNPKNKVPSPDFGVVSKFLKNDEDIKSNNLQGQACAALSSSLFISDLYLNSNPEKVSLISLTNNYTPIYFTMIKGKKKIHMKNKQDFTDFVYGIIFSDVAASATVESVNSKDTRKRIHLDNSMMFSKNDSESGKYVLRDSPGPEKFKMITDTDYMKIKIPGELCANVVSRLEKNYPEEFSESKHFNFHTAGKSYVNQALRSTGIDKEKAKLTFEKMKKTGNTGVISSLQLLDATMNDKDTRKGDWSGFGDYGWGKAIGFLYQIV